MSTRCSSVLPYTEFPPNKGHVTCRERKTRNYAVPSLIRPSSPFVQLMIETKTGEICEGRRIMLDWWRCSAKFHVER